MRLQFRLHIHQQLQLALGIKACAYSARFTVPCVSHLQVVVVVVMVVMVVVAAVMVVMMVVIVAVVCACERERLVPASPARYFPGCT